MLLGADARFSGEPTYAVGAGEVGAALGLAAASSASTT
jgi:hypothetical protein